MRQRMSTNTKRELLLRFHREYKAADRKKKSKLLNSLIEATGYNRKYAIALLNKAPSVRDIRRRTRKSKYGNDVVDAVVQLWRAANGICAQRLRPFLPTLIEALERCGHLKLDKRQKKMIRQMSLSTLERVLKKEREKQPKARSLTRPGSLLKKQVAVKTFAEWNDEQIGFLEADLVAHCGGDISGKFIHTLTMTDMATGWTEVMPVLNGTSAHVRTAMERVIGLLPFKIKGIDCDNGTEFLNHEMVAWCGARKITFTRSRAYRKNDQAHVEEKNGSVVRRLVGYARFEGSRSLEVMTELYSVSRVYINYFQPSMKLIKKTRIGAKVTKLYDTARTPLERLILCKKVSKKRKTTLHREFLKLDPLALLADMARLQTKLWNVVPSQPASDALAVVIDLEPSDELKREDKRAVSDSTSTKTTKRYPAPKSALPKNRKRTGGENKQQDLKDMRIEITDAFVENVASPSGQQIIYRDSRLVGFGLRVTPLGSKSYIVERRVNGPNRRLTIGRADLFSVEEARQEALQLLRQMISGVMPLTLRMIRKK